MHSEYPSSDWETIEELRDDYTSSSDSLLCELWEDHVGEWVLSRDDIMREYAADGVEDGEKILNTEFKKLLSDEQETSYGFYRGRIRHPPIGEDRST